MFITEIFNIFNEPIESSVPKKLQSTHNQKTGEVLSVEHTCI